MTTTELTVTRPMFTNAHKAMVIAAIFLVALTTTVGAFLADARNVRSREVRTRTAMLFVCALNRQWA